MIATPATTIYLPEQGGLHETPVSRSNYLFNYGNFYCRHRKAFGALQVFNNHLLAGNATITITGTGLCNLLLPVAGAVTCTDVNGATHCVAAGQVLRVETNQTITISNPFWDEAVNFLHIGMQAGRLVIDGNGEIITFEDVNQVRDRLANIINEKADQYKPLFNILLGKFSGRGETAYCAHYLNSDLFVFVVEGAFEVEGRLLHAGDGLALAATQRIEMEALSNDAIVLVLELNTDAPDHGCF